MADTKLYAQQRLLQEAAEQPSLLAALEPLHAPFFDEARLARLEAPAVSAADGTLSFAELCSAATVWAGRIEKQARGSSAPVAVLLDKSCAQVVGVLAVLASGRAYVPVSVSEPAERAAKILRAIEAVVALVPLELPPALAGLRFPSGCSPLVLGDVAPGPAPG